MFTLEYIWIQNIQHCHLRSATRILQIPKIKKLTNDNIQDIPVCKIDTITLKPAYVIRNPFTKNKKGYLVLCEQFNGEINNRIQCDLTLNKHYHGSYYFELNQEFYVDDPQVKKTKQNTASHIVGDFFSNHRDFIDTFVKVAVDTGLPISFVRSKSLNNWEFIMSDVMNTYSADVIWMSRYLLYRLSESQNFNIKFRNLVITFDGISTTCKCDTDPYLSISVMISMICKQKSQQELEKMKKENRRSMMEEQLMIKDEILKEAEKLQNELNEQFEIDELQKKEQEELERLNKMKEHQQLITQLRHEARLKEDERIAREEKIRIEMMKRQEQEERERVQLEEEKAENERLAAIKKIEDAELERLRRLKAEIKEKKQKEQIHEELEQMAKEKERINEELRKREEDERRQKEEKQKELQKKKEQQEMERLEKLMEDEFKRSKNME